MNYPNEIWADTDLVCSEEPKEGHQKYVRADQRRGCAAALCAELAVELDKRADNASEADHQSGEYGNLRHDSEIMRCAKRVFEREQNMERATGVEQRNTDIVDMQRDEFKRIIALNPSAEIIGICERAIACMEQTVPVIVQRDRLQSERNMLRLALVGLVDADGEELDGIEAMLRISPHVPEKDRASTINAIHALRDTFPA